MSRLLGGSPFCEKLGSILQGKETVLMKNAGRKRTIRKESVLGKEKAAGRNGAKKKAVKNAGGGFGDELSKFVIAGE